MRIVLVVLLLILVFLVTAGIVAWHFWGVWGVLGFFGLLVLFFYGLKALGARLVVRLLTAPFRLKGKVLRGAKVTVHAVTPAGRPDRADDFEEEHAEADLAVMFEDPAEREEFRLEMRQEQEESLREDERRHWWKVDLTIAPRQVEEGPFTHWEPGELLLADPRRRPRLDFDDDDLIGEVYDYEVWDEQSRGFVEDEFAKHAGELRLRLHVGVEPGRDRFALQYYLEQFGDVRLPADRA